MKNTCLILLLIFSSSSTFSQTVLRGPYLQSNSHNSIIVKWRTDISTPSKISYGTSLDELNEEVYIATSTTEHEVKIVGLSPHTKYYYAIGNAALIFSGPDENHHFRTHPEPGASAPLRAWVVGDQGKGNQGQIDVKNSYLNFAEGNPTDIWLWLGDNAYDDGTDNEFQTKSFEIYWDEKKYMPIWPTPGNHDYNSICPIPCDQDPEIHEGPYFDIMTLPTQGESGGVPSGTELYYSFDYGNTRFISLNSELGSLDPAYNYIGADPAGLFPGELASSADAENSPMMVWLKADLADAHEKNRDWIIVYWHQAPYSKGSHDTDVDWRIFQKAMRENWNPVLEEAGVDLVLGGHSHVYERSFLMKGHYGMSDELTTEMIIDGSSGNYDSGEPYTKIKEENYGGTGTVYSVVGNSGSRTTEPEMNHPIHYFGHGCGSCYGSLVIDIDGGRLDGTYLASDSTVMDRFTILKENTLTSTIEHTKADVLKNLNIYPNPFNGKTNIEYSIDFESNVTLSIHDLTGKKIADLMNERKNSGTHTFELNATKYNLTSGLYFVKITFNNETYFKNILNLR